MRETTSFINEFCKTHDVYVNFDYSVYLFDHSIRCELEVGFVNECGCIKKVWYTDKIREKEINSEVIRAYNYLSGIEKCEGSIKIMSDIVDHIFEFGITKVIFNDPATIVFWNDGSKTVVKCQDDDKFDKMVGLAMAICKKNLGNKGNYYNEFRKWMEED